MVGIWFFWSIFLYIGWRFLDIYILSIFTFDEKSSQLKTKSD